MFNYIMNKHKKSVDVSFIPNISKPIRGYKNMLKESQNKQALLKFRMDTIQAMNRNNYRNEYDRITGVLDKTIQHNYFDIPRLLNRKDELKRLYLQSFDPETIKHPLNEYHKNKIK